MLFNDIFNNKKNCVDLIFIRIFLNVFIMFFFLGKNILDNFYVVLECFKC